MTDPIDRIVRLVLAEFGRELEEGPERATVARVTADCRGEIEAEFNQWAKANEEIRKLEEDAAAS